MKTSAVQNKLKSFPATISKPQSDFVFFGLDLFYIFVTILLNF